VGRVWVYSVAGATLLVALILAIAGVGEVPGALTNWQAFTLGLVQGATELLPVSSSGHLILVPWLADWTYLEQNDSFNKTFDVALHLGTLVAVVAYFWHDILELLAALGRSISRRRIETRDERIVWFVVVATIPAVAIGAATADLIDEHLGEPWQIAIFLAVFGVLLYIADRTPQRRSMGDLNLRQAVVMGFAQCLALMPGVSRSGITITAGRFMGLDRD
jgi:undecaprenyl-diphosphatase